MDFVEAPAFTRHISGYLTDDAYREVQESLDDNPEIGDVMPGTGGFRKLRWADARRSKGRRGGLRIIYFYFPAQHQVWFMALYDKSEASDLTAKEKKALKTAIETELKAREVGRIREERKPRGTDSGKARHFWRTDGRRGGDEGSSRRQDHSAQL